MRSVALSSSLALAIVATSASEASGRMAQWPELTRKLPQLVQGECAKALVTSPVRFVCPPLVPVSKYIKRQGLYGTFNGTEDKAKITLLSFNHGDVGPGYWHWIAGMGTRAGINRWVLSDAQNVVKGKPKLFQRRWLGGHEVKIWRFPPHPAGGQFGGTTLRLRARVLCSRLRACTARASSHRHGWRSRSLARRLQLRSRQ